MTLNKLREEISKEKDEKRAEVNKRFFKSGKGEYGEGDIFIGLSVPKCRKIAIKYSALSLGEVQKILSSKIHEERLIALEILVNDNHDLIHKAVGWMLREIGKRDEEILRKFLNDNYKKMPRTMLRYAIERFSQEERKGFMRK